MWIAACALPEQVKQVNRDKGSTPLAVTAPKLGGVCADPGFRIVWSDEFAGTSIDAASWTFENGDGSQYGIPGLPLFRC